MIIQLFVQSSIHLFVHWFIHFLAISFILSCVHSLVCHFIRAQAASSLFNHSFTYLFIHLMNSCVNLLAYVVLSFLWPISYAYSFNLLINSYVDQLIINTSFATPLCSLSLTHKGLYAHVHTEFQLGHNFNVSPPVAFRLCRFQWATAEHHARIT